MPKAIYKLGWANRNPDHVDYPTRTRQLLANIQAGESDPIPLYMQLIDLFVDTEDWSQVVRHGNKQLALVDKAKHVAGKYHVLKALAQASRTVGSLGAAIAFSTRYVSLAKAQGNAEELVDAYLELGLAEIAQGESSDGLPQDFRSAQTSFRNALDAIKQSTTISSKDAKRIQGEITMNVGICLKSLGQIDEAMRYFTRALEVFQGLKLLAYQANAYCNIAICFDAKHDAKRALESGLVELALRRQERDSTGELQAIIDNGHRLSALGRYADAFENYELAQKLAAELEDDESEDSAKRFASTAKEHLKALEEIVRLKASLGSARGNSAQFSILANLVKSYLFLGRGLNARLDLNEQIRLAKAMNLPSSETALLSLNLGLAYELEGNFADAVLALVDGLKNMSATSNYATQVEWKQALLRVLISNEASYSQIEKLISEIIHTCDIINDLKGQREALRALVQLNKRYDFYEKLKVSELQLKRIDLLINAAGIGSSQQEGFDEFDNSLSTEPPVELPQSSPRIIMGDIVEQYTRAPALVERNSMAKRTRHIISLDSEQDSPRSPPKELDPVATASSSAFSQEIRQLVEREQSSSPILQVQSRAIVFSEMSSPLLQPAPTNNVQVIIDPLSDDQHITPTKIKRPRPKSDFFDIEDGLTPPMKERNDIFDFDDDLTPPRKENRAEKIGSPLRNTKKTESGMRVNVVVSTPDSEPRILSIPCADGLLGTPKTISWLKREAENRYFELCNEKCSLKGLLEATDCTKPLLNGEALIRDILKNDQYVYGDHISEGYEWGRL